MKIVLTVETENGTTTVQRCANKKIIIESGLSRALKSLGDTKGYSAQIRRSALLFRSFTRYSL